LKKGKVNEKEASEGRGSVSRAVCLYKAKRAEALPYLVSRENN
jgi:hypothetical protein